jgi:hypothetical protein
MRNAGIFVAVIAAVTVGFQVSDAHGAGAGPKKVKYADVQKILTAKCVGCHGAGRPRGGIDLTNYKSVMKGGEDGPIVKAGDPSKSNLYLAVSGAPNVRQMPPRGPKLDAKDLKTIEAWIKGGAKN